MQKPEPNIADLENALCRLMPVAISDDTQERMDAMLDELVGETKTVRFEFGKPAKWLAGAGIAAALGLGVFFSMPDRNPTLETVDTDSDPNPGELPPELVFLSETDRVEGVSDDGLFIDTGGSAVRKVRFRVIEESQIRDEESGIVVVLTEPREEMYLVPVSTF